MTLQGLESFFSTPQEDSPVMEFKSGKVKFEKVHLIEWQTKCFRVNTV